MCAGERKADVEPHRLLVEREKLVPRVMVLAGVCVGGKGHLYFLNEKAKVIAAYYLKNCCHNWWKIVNSCYGLVSSFSKTALWLTRQASHRTG